MEANVTKLILEFLPIICTVGLIPVAWIGLNILFKGKKGPKPPPSIKFKRYW